MTYLSFSLTPVLSDTLDKLYLKVENGKVTQLLAQTEILYYGSNTEEDPDAMSYSDVKISFSNVGTTVVESPKPFDAPDYADKLQAALEKCKTLKTIHLEQQIHKQVLLQEIVEIMNFLQLLCSKRCFSIISSKRFCIKCRNCRMLWSCN